MKKTKMVWRQQTSVASALNESGVDKNGENGHFRPISRYILENELNDRR